MRQAIENRILTCLALIICLMLSACAGFPLSKGKEPQTIIIRNRCQIGLAEVSLRESPKLGGGPVRHGAISPVPRGIYQVLIRPSNPPPLPKTLIVQWIDDSGRRYTQNVAIRKILRESTGHPDEVLFFDIYPQGEVLVFLGNRVYGE
jgi:hypothetical protein